MKENFFTKIFQGIEILAFNSYWNNFSKMDLDKASQQCANFTRRFGPLTGAHKTAKNNLHLAFPNFSDAEIKEILDAMWDNLGRIAGEMPHLGKLGYFTENSRVEVKGLEILDRYLENGKGAVFASGHFANWEIMPAVIVQRGVNCEVTYRALNNKKIDEAVRAARAAYGVTLFAPKGREGGMRLMRILAKGGSIAMMNDQKYDTGVSSPLFGHNCMTNDAAVRLAHRFKIPIQTMSLKRTQGANFITELQEPIMLDFAKPIEEIVQSGVDTINQFLENKIKEAPEQWFWVHRRWPKQAWRDAGII